MEIRAVVLNPQDNVAVVLQKVTAGDHIIFGKDSLIAKENIPIGHKICIKAIPDGSNIMKYGTEIGRANQNIAVGSWVHSHNVTDTTEEICNTYAESYRAKNRRAEK